MKKKYIIKKNYHIQKIIFARKSVSNKYFIVFTLDNSLDYFRFVVSIGKKVGKAVVRNKIKRQIKALIYQNKYKIKKNYDILIIVRPSIISLKYLAIEENLTDILRKANLISE